ncbi:sugar phosphate isomerase/epimerase family protein [Ruminococcus flavefaciens]|uniref:sugar phosphate isomerase/epimerase family protein n=1 Tax=Ruminococcus flavefaciens TaxID=1265 RepID=UPI0026F1A4DD|nr:sugar phosphate isomerase/epimerase family protein [Ruminococcus flavefaciens]MDD7516350.1 sugar phosphate isomerase/epimerase [Ruminococcus flavefaciens]MDY5692237.1 sugar phosphate isomerase/epimerase family protein [Ruminococcus flavefaciens]
MELSISNLGWYKNEQELYSIMHKLGYTGLEIAPTKLFGDAPYEQLDRAAEWAEGLRKEYDITVPSIQSIWYGRKEKLFRSEDEYRFLLDYTKKAVDFASAIKCGNLVFGCPAGRITFVESDYEKGKEFFRSLGDHAVSKNTCIGLEANPVIYKTNYINDTASAISLIREIASEGLKLNLDTGTMIENKEGVEMLAGCVKYFSHVHISEPFLAPIKQRSLHYELSSLLHEEGYSGAISIEMHALESISQTTEIMQYIREVFFYDSKRP